MPILDGIVPDGVCDELGQPPTRLLVDVVTPQGICNTWYVMVGSSVAVAQEPNHGSNAKAMVEEAC